MISQQKVHKISKVYFSNVTGGGLTSDNLTNHFVTQLIAGAQETQEYDGELYLLEKGTVKI
jgi:hypothetical protein